MRRSGSLFLVFLLAGAAFADEPVVRFNRDVRPILSQHCGACHGPDARARKADLRLDDFDSATAPRESGAAIAPGDPSRSLMLARIDAADPAERMPPPDHPLPLSDEQKTTLRRWIAQGAKYEPHWAYIPPHKADPSALDSGGWARHPFDRFALAGYAERSLSPASEADRATLARRVSLALTGLPLSPEEIDDFVADDSPDAYERLVDRLLASPRYGERMAVDWLDVARYADSGGYQGDLFRTMWPWRDWVIDALNSNMPYDRFTIEQIAGDLLPNPTRDQLIATGFHRNHRINDEEGIVLEEFRVEYVVDRLETTATVWLGQTIGCCRCHSHKYDPFSQREFYGLFAYFNSVAEEGKGNGFAPPILRLSTPQQEAAAAPFEARIREVEAERELYPASEVAARDVLTKRIAALGQQRDAAYGGAVVTLILKDLPKPRPTFLLIGGAYDKPSEPVEPGVPATLHPLPEGAPANRLGLARWLVDRKNPLTARVVVNRMWQQFFGAGICPTTEDLGSQGKLPSHPELLDWLAVEFMDNGWDVKSLHRQIVTSAVYRQSAASPDSFARDPENRWLARGPRFRLSPEMIRDQALTAAGLLTRKIGGPAARPYQPDGLWKELASNELEYNQSHGADLYRRSVYTFWRRTMMPPAMAVFDAPSRESCVARRPRTNTPLQALVLMNDPTYVEAARGLAGRALASDGDDAAKVALAFRLVLGRSPRAAESEALAQTLELHRKRFQTDEESAKALLSVGELPVDPSRPVAETAAWTATLSALLSLDETISSP